MAKSRDERIEEALSKYSADKRKECQEKGIPYTPDPLNLVQLISDKVDAEMEEEKKPKKPEFSKKK